MKHVVLYVVLLLAIGISVSVYVAISDNMTENIIVAVIGIIALIALALIYKKKKWLQKNQW